MADRICGWTKIKYKINVECRNTVTESNGHKAGIVLKIQHLVSFETWNCRGGSGRIDGCAFRALPVEYFMIRMTVF
jgi:hypothetical protein